MKTLLPLPVVVTRYKCPTCGRTHSSKSGAVKHIDRCWYNPTAKGCKTCKHYTEASGESWEPYPTDPESCDRDVSLAGSTECRYCTSGVIYGYGTEPPATCTHCGGSGSTDGPVRKPGPIVHCALWEAKEETNGE